MTKGHIQHLQLVPQTYWVINWKEPETRQKKSKSKFKVELKNIQQVGTKKNT